MTDLYPNLPNCQGCCESENELMTPARTSANLCKDIPETFIIIILIVQVGFAFNFKGIFMSARANSAI